MSTKLYLSDYYQHHREELVSYATKLLKGDRMTAEDMVQSTFLRLLTSCHLVTPTTLPALVYTTLRNQLIDHFRYCQRRQRFESNSQYALESTNDLFVRCSTHQLKELIGRRIDRMTPQTVQVMRLHIFGQCPVSEIAEILSLQYKKAENCLLSGRKQLRPYVRQLISV